MNKTMSRAIASAWLLAMLVAQVHATTNLYTWDGSASDGDWFNAANWTGPTGDGIPGQTHNVATSNIDQAAIGNISGAITYMPGTPVVFDYLNITKSDAALLTLSLNGGMTTTHANVTATNWNATTEVLGGGGNLVLNVIDIRISNAIQWGHPERGCLHETCLLYTSPSPRDRQKSRMPSSA